MRSRETKSVPESFGQALGTLVRQLGITKTLRQYDVIMSWDAIVGEKIAKVAKAQRMENGTLFVSVASAPWRAELTIMRREIIEKINAAMGNKIVKDIRFR